MRESWLTTVGGVWFLFEKADETLSTDIRRKAADWLTSPGLGQAPRTWPRHFVVLFDQVFGDRHLTWRCFRRSGVASLCSVWIATLLWAIWNPPTTVADGAFLFVAVTMIGIIVNLVPDYVSLLETRYVLGRMVASGQVAGPLFMDVLLTALIGITPYVVLLGMAFNVPVIERIQDTVTLRDTMTIRSESAMPIGVFFYSTFFTSVWLWLFALAGVAVRVGRSLGSAASFLWRITDVEKKPFRSLGLVAVLLVTLLYVGAAPIVFLMTRVG